MQRSTVQSKSALGARIFDVLAWVVLAAGAIGVLLVIDAVIDSGDQSGLVVALGLAVVTVVAWASISLYTVAAGFISVRLAEAGQVARAQPHADPLRGRSGMPAEVSTTRTQADALGKSARKESASPADPYAGVAKAPPRVAR